MFTILRFGRHCSLINHYGIHMWLKRSLTAFQRIFLRFQVEGCSTDRDCVSCSLYMDLVHSLHFEFQFFMDAEEICVYYHYFCCVFFFCCFPSVFFFHRVCTPARVSKFPYSALNSPKCVIFGELTHRTVRSFRIYIILMTTAIELAAGLTFDILRWAERNTERCEEKITTHRQLTCLDRAETFNYLSWIFINFVPIIHTLK